MPKSWIADFILYFHFLYVLGVLIPIPLIFFGAKRNWSWIRNRWLRRIHLLMILFVVFESLIGMMCPLTELEKYFRQSNYQKDNYPSGFIAEWISHLLFYEFAPWIFTLLYVFVAIVIVALYVKIPPTKRSK